ncbi:MAG: DUF998 domain-containing protein, partial [Dehalococcoidia bacterium]
AFVVGAGAIVPGYDHVSQHVSELARRDGERAWVLRLGLVLVGLLDLVLARGLAAEAESRTGRSVARLVGFLGVATMGTGVLPLEPADAASDALARAHVGAAATAFAFDTITPLVFARAPEVRGDRGMRVFSLLSGAAAAVLLVPVAFGWWPAYHGATQRAFLVAPFLWTGGLGAWLLRRARRGPARG